MKILLLVLSLATSLDAADLWRGTLHLKEGKTMTGVIEDVSPTAIKFISKGDAYWFKIADLPAATRGELDIGVTTDTATPEDKAAYLADLPRRQAQAALAAAAARDRAASAARLAERDRTYEQEQRAKKQAEMRAFQARENERRKTEALEQIALELQLRRLNGGR